MIFCFIIRSIQFQLVYNQYSLLTNDFDQQSFTSTQGIQINQKGWNHIGSTSEISQCTTPYNTVSVYGVTNFGQGAIIFKTFDLPPHHEIQIQFQFWIVDYQQNYQYKVYVDGYVVGVITESDLSFTQNLCGFNFFDSYATYTFNPQHIGSQATIIITSTIDQQITTWGIRDFIFRFSPCPLNCIQCYDSISICNLWQFQEEYWTTPQIINSEGWNYNIGSYQTFQCIGQSFLKIQQADTLTQNIILKPNYMFRIQFYLLKAGHFMGESIQFSINSYILFQQTFNNEIYLTQCAGVNDGDQSINFSQDYQFQQFNTKNLQLKFSSDIQSNSRFFGLRNFYLFIAPCISNCLLCTTNNDCQQCEIYYYFDGTQCVTTQVIPPSIYTLYQSQQNIILNQFTQTQKTQCNSYQIYGGYQQQNTIQFNITDMPFHNQFRIKINIIAIDKWLYYNTLQLFLDGQQYNIINRNKYDDQNQQNLCGSDVWNDNLYYIDILYDHYSSFLLVKLQFMDQSIIQYYGVLDISIDYYYCGPKYKCSRCDSSGTQCLDCSDINRLLINNCECTSSPNIQSSFCPDCSLKVQSSIYCNNVDLCYNSQNYIPVCPSNGCEWGYTFNTILNQCFFDWPTLQDQYPIIQSHSIFNDPNYVSYDGLKFYDRQGQLMTEQISYCGSQKLLGGFGFNGKISMDFNNSPPYRRIRISYIIFLIDNDEGLIIEHYLNQKQYKFQKWSQIPKSQQLCGSAKPEFFTKIEYMIAVSGDFNFQITISNSINDNLLGNFGIYDINVYYQPCGDQIKCSTCDDNGCLTCSDLQRIQSPQCDCPTYEYGNNKNCPTCPYKCQQNSCDISGCLQCANPSRGQPPDCLCSTYEVYGDPSCPVCQLNCLKCTQNICTQCETGYYSQGEYCQKCPYQCETCLQNGCLTCSDPQRSSPPFCRCPTFEIFGQSTCPLCPQNCSECDQQGCLVCNQLRELPFCQCSQNYYEMGGQCFECMRICKTCDQNGCLTCHRQELILPDCTCPNGQIEINQQCMIDITVIQSYGVFDQSLKQIIISFNIQFIVLSLQNQQTYKEENCAIIKNSKGRCLIKNQKIYYQFDQPLQYKLDDVIEIQKEYFSFVDIKSFKISPVLLKIDPSLNYQPQFNLNYPLKILQCRKYLIYIEEIINFGTYGYLIEVINQDSIEYSILNKTILFKAKNQGQLQIGIKITNFVKYSQIKMINVSVVNDYNLEFEVLSQIGQVNRYFDLYINILNIKLENCISTGENFTKMIEININDIPVTKQVTNQQEYKQNINLGMLNQEQTQQLNITISYQQLSNTYLKNYTITQIKPFFSIIGGNRMIYYNNRLNVSAVIVDPDNLGLICEWQCLKLETNQDCGFNFTSEQYQIIERYQLELYQTYQFIYDCLGNIVYANYYVTDINEDQLFLFYPIMYSNYEQNQLIPIEYFIFNETNKNQLMPIQRKNIGIRIIQNQTILNQSYQENSFGFKLLENLQGNLLIQSQINQMISSINMSLYKSEKINFLSVNIQQGIAILDKFEFSLINFNYSNPPYLFQYLVKINDQVTYHLSKWSQYSEQSFIFPQGIQSKNYSLEIILQIMDGFGYISNQSQIIIVKQISEEINKLDYYQQLFNNYSIYDDYFITLGYQLLSIQEDGCLSNCSNNGICKVNRCICKDNFYLNDCSANQSQFQSLINQTNTLLQQLLKQDSYISNNIMYQLLQNQYIYNNIEFNIIEQIINFSCYQISKFTHIQNIQQSDIDIFIKRIPQNNLFLINYDSQQELKSLINILDLSFGLIGFDSPIQIQNRTLQNEYNIKLLNTSKNLSLYMGLQQYIDQEPYKFDGKYLNIISQKVSSDYSQQFFNDPLFIKDQINESFYQLQNESVISTVIYNTNPYLADISFPYQSTNTQVASLQVFDSKGLQYRSFIPMFIEFKPNNTDLNNTVCIGQVVNNWINNICKTIRLTNQIICSCDTVNQLSIVNDVDNLYSNSNLQILANFNNFMKFDFVKSYVAYILILFTIGSLIFSFIGYKKDKIDIIQFNRQKQFKSVIQQLEYDSEEEDVLKNYDIFRFRKRQLKLEIFIGLQVYINKQKKLHSFLRIYNEFLIDQPRPARYKIYFLKQCILLSMTIVFGKGFSIIQNITLSLISLMLVTPLEKIIIVGFAFNASMKLKITIQGIVMLVYSSCWYICTTIAATVGIQKSNYWTLIFIISFLINNFLVEAISIILKIIFSPFIDSFINKGKQNFIKKLILNSCLIRFVYLYLYDPQALTIVRKINHYDRPSLTQ